MDIILGIGVHYCILSHMSFLRLLSLHCPEDDPTLPYSLGDFLSQACSKSLSSMFVTAMGVEFVALAVPHLIQDRSFILDGAEDR